MTEHSNALLELHQACISSHETAQSIGDKDRRSGVVKSDTEKRMYKALTPPGLVLEDCEGLVDRAKEVLALPGMSRMEEFGVAQPAAEGINKSSSTSTGRPKLRREGPRQQLELQEIMSPE
jgi:hypothetical protein